MRGYSFGVRKLRSAYVHPEKVAQAGTVGARGHQRQAARARPDGWEGEFRDLGSRAFRTTAAPKAYQESDRVAVRAARIDEPRMYKVTDPNAPGDRPDTPSDDADAPIPPESTEQNEPGKGAGRNTNVQRPAEDQTKQPTKENPGARGSGDRLP